MSTVRQPAVAGLFYPADPVLLRRQISQFMQTASVGAATPKALVAPHAGYVYSGPVAASAYTAIRDLRQQIGRVVLLGPAHRVYVRGLAAVSVDVFRTPLGDVPVDTKAVRDLAAEFAFVDMADEAHADEHSLEVHLPFLQETLGEFCLIPLAVGAATPEQIDMVLARLWGGPETLIIISTDLSHYHPYSTAVEIDRKTSNAIQALEPEAIGEDHACGRIPLCGLLREARRRGMTAQTIDLRNSGDTAGTKDRVVGYGAYLFFEPPENEFSESHRKVLNRLAWHSIRCGLRDGIPPTVQYHELESLLRKVRGSFVTLTKDGKLRGCVGTISPQRPLAVDVVKNAYAAAFKDPRFDAADRVEIDELRLQISVLSQPVELRFESELDLLRQIHRGVHGLILTDGAQHATFLPAVWETIREPEDFLSQLKKKVGLASDYWSESIQAKRYTTETWSADSS